MAAPPPPGGAPGGGAPPGGAAAAAAAAIIPSFTASYRSFYDTATNDPLNGSYAVVMAPFDIPVVGPSPATPQELASSIYNATQTRTPTCMLTVGPDNLIHMYH